MATTYVTAVYDLDYSNFEFSLRSEPVDYQHIKAKSVELLGKHTAARWAIASNLEGLTPRESKHITDENGNRIYSKHILSKLATQDGHVDYDSVSGRSKAKEMGKDIVTIQRLARAFASDTIKYIENHPERKLNTGLEIDGLPKKYQFLNSPWGMSDYEITSHWDNLVKMFSKWNSIMANATSEGWNKPKNGEKKDYVKVFVDYCRFRGITKV